MSPDLVRRRQAVVALAWFGGMFFALLIGINVVQALSYGYGLAHGHVQEGAVSEQGGHGWLLDGLVLAGALLACGALVAAWSWLGSRLPISSPAEEVVGDDEPFYVIEIPGITRVLTIVGVTCAVAVALSGSILFPVILVTYGW